MPEEIKELIIKFENTALNIRHRLLSGPVLESEYRFYNDELEKTEKIIRILKNATYHKYKKDYLY